MAACDPRIELETAQAELQLLENRIFAKQAEAEAAKDKNGRASLRLEVQSAERQKAAATRRVKAAQVKLRKMELSGSNPTSPSAMGRVAASIADEWQEHICPQTGNAYYCNVKTGESSWTKPVSQPTLANVVATPVEPQQAAAKAEEWTEHVDPQSGRTFFFNAATGETSWTQPTSASQQQSTQLPGTTSASQDDWTEHVDPGSGNKFYYNARTGETSWTSPKPALKEVLPAQVVATASDSEWIENVDPSTGQKFYFNILTQESSWTQPSTLQQPLQCVQPICA